MSTNETERNHIASGSQIVEREERVEILIDGADIVESGPTPIPFIENPDVQSVKPDEETETRHLLLYRAALNGDWDMAEKIITEHPHDKTATLSRRSGNTILHVAALAESSLFAEKLLEGITEGDLAIRNNDGNTAFCLAAASGKVKLAKSMIKKKADLAKIPGKRKMLPLETAALFGHREMVDYLYKVTDHGLLDSKDGLQFLIALIRTGLFDIALSFLKDHPELATVRDANHETALHFLARMPIMSSNYAEQNHQGIVKRFFNQCTNMYGDKSLPQAGLDLIEYVWKKLILDESNIPSRPVFVAAKQGNIQFLTILIREYPEVILKVDDNNCTIFHWAVLKRQNDIFKLIHEVGSFKDFIVLLKDGYKNNILHLAGKLAPTDRLNIVSGAALQLQLELLWFKEVSKMVHPLDAEAENLCRQTPRALFTEEHKKLKEDGEKWMKDTANNCMLVATLITTVVFAAAFTIPGGLKDENGTPHLIREAAFKTFVISDAVALVLSSSSIINFLSILTSRYAEEDFLYVLPRKLLAGLATLLLSIGAMMVVFCTTIFVLFKDEALWVPILVTVIGSVPVLLFTKQQWRLFFDVARSTYMSSSLFRPSKLTLFAPKVV